METLNEKEHKAIELKYEGMPYQSISRAFEKRYTVSTLKKYFSKGGRLYLPYKDYAEEQTSLRRKFATNILQSAAIKAARAIVQVLNKSIENRNDTITLKASQIILDRVGIPAVKRIDSEKDSLQDELEPLWDENPAGSP